MYSHFYYIILHTGREREREREREDKTNYTNKTVTTNNTHTHTVNEIGSHNSNGRKQQRTKAPRAPPACPNRARAAAGWAL